ncbi:hypothetical protein ACSDR0_50290 [Streptosporangium sp. G11]|uniref:hypothetical protein n=1 Tax=Streptosporangium sp. G11 TaxID=3436926 RepID=UPI003EBDF6D1
MTAAPDPRLRFSLALASESLERDVAVKEVILPAGMYAALRQVRRSGRCAKRVRRHG